MQLTLPNTFCPKSGLCPDGFRPQRRHPKSPRTKRRSSASGGLGYQLTIPSGDGGGVMRDKSYQVKRRLSVSPSTRLSPGSVIHSCQIRLYNLCLPPTPLTRDRTFLDVFFFSFPRYLRVLQYIYQTTSTPQPCLTIRRRHPTIIVISTHQNAKLPRQASMVTQPVVRSRGGLPRHVSVVELARCDAMSQSMALPAQTAD